jgi:CheY-like chemotaxis protein
MGSILVIEDDYDFRESLADLLRREGYAVRTAEGGDSALKALKVGEPPSLILLDLMMVEMSGWKFRAEQQKDPRLAAIPVIVLSGAADFSAAASLNAVACLKKPVELDVLLANISNHVKPNS